MNERPPSGYSPDYDAYGYDAYSQGSYQAVGTAFADPAPDATGTFDAVGAYDSTGAYPHIAGSTPHGADHGGAYPSGSGTGYGSTTGFTTAGYGTGGGGNGGGSGGGYAYDPAAGSYDTGVYPTYDTGTYDTGTYDTATYDTGTYTAYAGATGSATGTYYDTGTYDTTAWQGAAAYTEYPETTGFQVPYQAQAPHEQTQQEQTQQDWDSGAYPAYGYGYGYGYDASGDTGIHEQVPQQVAREARQQVHEAAEPVGSASAAAPEAHSEASEAPVAPEDLDEIFPEPPPEHSYAHDLRPGGPGPGGVEEPAARSRRRKPHKRSALLTVAVPSVAVMGVAAVGAAAVAGVGVASDSSKAQATGQNELAKAPTTQFDRQLAGVDRDANDFATRASRTQERIDLKDRQVAAKKAKALAAARKEALRPKFLLPVAQRGLSAYFGQAGVNWMALHTGIDFPVQVGTPVMAATDGTVRTQWNSSYGNMAIVTAPDGTETWYCHLSSTKIRSGTVKAGEVIAYSGNTGNTTGPHLHFEVRPGGGAPIDPLPWLLAHGLDPR